MGSPGGWLRHSATVSKPGWKGSEERTEAVKAACLPRARRLLPLTAALGGCRAQHPAPLQLCPGTSRFLGTKTLLEPPGF